MSERYFFRGKRLDNEKWMQGNLVYLDEEHVGIWTENAQSYIWIDPATIGQCTGLKDKNGTLIFEGDVCRVKKAIFEIVYNDCGLYAKIKKNGSSRYGHEVVKTCYELIDELCEKGLEIIGNIHESPELLKEAMT